MNKQNKILLKEWLPRTCTWHDPKGFVNSKDAKKGMKTSNGWIKHRGAGIFTVMKMLKEFSSWDDEDACICKKLSGSAETYF